MGDWSRKMASRRVKRWINAKKMAHRAFIESIQSSKKWIFEGWLLRVGFQKCASGCSGEHIFANIWKQNASEQKKYRKSISQTTCLMKIRNNIWDFHKFASVILVVVLWIGLINKKYTFFQAKIKILMGDRSRKKANRTGKRAISAKKMAHWSFI